MSWLQLNNGDRPSGIISSASESEAFGLRFGRLVIPLDGYGDEPFTALDEVDRFDVIVVRYPATELGWFTELTVEGYRTIYADTLMYWSSGPPTDGRKAHGDLVVDFADGTQIADISTVATSVFGTYRNHYDANPLLGKNRARDGYVDWAIGLADDPATDVLLARSDDGAAIAFAAVHHVQPTDDVAAHSEIILAGTVAGKRGGGVYSRLLGVIEARAAEVGSTRVVISTQASNTGVQRQWARAGWLPEFAVTTVHLVSCSALELHESARG